MKKTSCKMIDPKRFALPARTVILEVTTNHFAIVVERKSRIIMADGQKILDKVERIKSMQPESKVSLKTCAPLCSKTRTFLSEHDIDIIQY